MFLNKTVKVTKIFSFEMAHALWGYNGECRNIHGYSYQLHVTFEGIPFQPTCENLLLSFVQEIHKELPEACELFSLRLYETATSFVEWEQKVEAI